MIIECLDAGWMSLTWTRMQSVQIICTISGKRPNPIERISFVNMRTKLPEFRCNTFSVFSSNTNVLHFTFARNQIEFESLSAIVFKYIRRRRNVGGVDWFNGMFIMQRVHQFESKIYSQHKFKVHSEDWFLYFINQLPVYAHSEENTSLINCNKNQ